MRRVPSTYLGKAFILLQFSSSNSFSLSLTELCSLLSAHDELRANTVQCKSAVHSTQKSASGRYWLPTTGLGLTIGIATGAGKAGQSNQANQLTVAGVGRGLYQGFTEVQTTRALNMGVR
ncbi:hypothetical protein EDB81DRAFT_39542 [Dactylonectria macrodidyma]|uniref:Uncharacterized protein n=1 Tax=Dactylonectria macrodidyma TaxID=307937 RepID=A0A9P9FVV9_9HYPO|nr:hypothetical protein EDB81DRAFT_39542 [Dactylonectria macrodidyma]